MKAKKSLGQHFLKSERALNTIVESAHISPGETVLEIGPGQGALTEKLLSGGATVTAVEKDDELFEFLKTKFSEEISRKQIIFIHEDILDFDPSLIAGGYKLVANIPYNITGAILEKFLSADHQPEKMVLLVQKEVAERIAALDGKESILSVSVKAYGVPRYVEKVLAGSFVPAPKVDSAIISIENISKTFFDGFPEDEFFKLLKTGFKSKRKKLSSNLSTVYDKTEVKNAFQSLNIDENARAEELAPQKWSGLAKLFCYTK
jgi:16S rRNA (adenine1518-N6/adenine1519-N6)-dimethyltransferase